ncbi:hypothetical protein BGZ54_006825 [Gamsiella multidivaricata]|nr:hypothetical protein BGZ54_006825 [Gamsiella multidivaricata]
MVPFVLFFSARVWRLVSRFDRNTAIYQSRFAEPADLIALGTGQRRLNPGTGVTKGPTIIGASDPSSSPVETQKQLRDQVHGYDSYSSEREKVFELTNKTLKEIALSKRWYNRYKTATDMQMLGVAAVYLIITLILAIFFQFRVPSIGFNPVYYECHTGPEYAFPYITALIFLFMLSPFMIFQLKGTNDGFGIRNELIFMTTFSAPCVALFFIMPVVLPEFTRKYLDKTTYIALILIVSHIASILTPLVRHFKEYPHQCAYTAMVFQRNTYRSKLPATALGSIDRKHRAGNNGADIRDRSGSEDIPLEGTRQTGGKESSLGANKVQFTLVTTPAPAARDKGDTREVYYAQTSTSGSPLGYSRKNSISNINLTLKSLIRSHRREHFGIGSSTHGTIIDSKKTDWDEFIKALEDRELFDRMSAFTVREFCAENMRFLYEVSRLEKRAFQYEHLRNLTATPHELPLDNPATNPSLSMVDHTVISMQTSPATPTSTRLTKTPSSGTSHSTIAPLPTQFPQLSAKADGSDTNRTPHRIKKIVSVSSVSSTVHMLGPRRSSSSYFDDSEPSSPLGSFTFPNLHRHGSSSSALPDLELGIVQDPSARQTPSATILESSPQNILTTPGEDFRLLPMPPTLLIQFEYVYKTFIVSGSRLEVNLSYATAQEIHQKAKRGEWQSSMFDGAIYEIQELLFRDVWPKFVTSSHGLNYNGSAAPMDRTRLQEVDTANAHTTNAVSDSRSSACLSPEQQPTSPQRSTPPSSILTPSPMSSMSRAASARAKAVSSK